MPGAVKDDFKDIVNRSKARYGESKASSKTSRSTKKGKKGKRKKKEPRCPIERRKKAIVRKCVEPLDPIALLNSYYVCHAVPDMLKYRGFKWKKPK